MEALRLLRDKARSVWTNDPLLYSLQCCINSDKYTVPDQDHIDFIVENASDRENAATIWSHICEVILNNKDCHCVMKALYIMYICRNHFQHVYLHQLKQKVSTFQDGRSSNRLFVSNVVRGFGKYVLAFLDDPTNHIELLTVALCITPMHTLQEFPMTSKCYHALMRSAMQHIIALNNQAVELLGSQPIPILKVRKIIETLEKATQFQQKYCPEYHVDLTLPSNEQLIELEKQNSDEWTTRIDNPLMVRWEY